MSSWPNPKKPFIPKNHKENGWHWLSFNEEKPIVLEWKTESFFDGKTFFGEWQRSYQATHVPSRFFNSRWEYLGPCLTPEEIKVLLAKKEEDND